MKNSNIQLAAVTGAIIAAVALRLVPHPPNFTPIAAMALFGGAFLADRRWAFVVPFAALLLSDIVIASTSYAAAGVIHGVSFPLIPFLYGSYLLTIALGCWVRKRRTALPIAVATLAGSVLFFVVTNFGVWATSTYYDRTLHGLAVCYAAAIPFFRYTLAGDALFTLVLFGGYALAQRHVAALREPASEPVT